MQRNPDFMLSLREALAASWDERTSYLGAKQAGNPALGQCYPTSKVVQHYYPETEIVKSTVWTGRSTEIHFWNVLQVGDDLYHIDLSWQQFPVGSIVREFQILRRQELNDSDVTVQRCTLLLKRVEEHLSAKGRRFTPDSALRGHCGYRIGTLIFLLNIALAELPQEWPLDG